MLRNLLHHEIGALEIGDHLSKFEIVGSWCTLDDGTYAFAAFFVGQTDNRHVTNFGMLIEEVFDFLGRNVFALTDDDVLQATGKHDVSVGIEVPDVASAEPTIGIECVGIQ